MKATIGAASALSLFALAVWSCNSGQQTVGLDSGEERRDAKLAELEGELDDLSDRLSALEGKIGETRTERADMIKSLEHEVRTLQFQVSTLSKRQALLPGTGPAEARKDEANSQ